MKKATDRGTKGQSKPKPGNEASADLGLGVDNVRGEVSGCPTGLVREPKVQPPEHSEAESEAARGH